MSNFVLGIVWHSLSNQFRCASWAGGLDGNPAHLACIRFPRFRSLLLGSVGQCARQAPHAPPGCFQGAPIAPEFSTVVTPQIPSTLRALRATIPVRAREACL